MGVEEDHHMEVDLQGFSEAVAADFAGTDFDVTVDLQKVVDH